MHDNQGSISQLLLTVLSFTLLHLLVLLTTQSGTRIIELTEWFMEWWIVKNVLRSGRDVALFRETATTRGGGRTHVCRYKERQSNPMTGLDRTWGFQEAGAPRFQDNRHMKVVRLSALHTGRLYPQEIFLNSFLLKAESTPGPQCGRKDVNEKF
jgi:hypothetical protein